MLFFEKYQNKTPSKIMFSIASNYAINQFEKFQRYLDFDKLSIDKNHAARAIKPLLIGRKIDCSQISVMIYYEYHTL
ncbi:transposase [Pseudoalteromonas sp. S558]|uniref:IS66 family transposase n=1 Tax=Pseudoalteromonas sp. S558 TaxID=2066515 RepID=UPI0033944E03